MKEYSINGAILLHGGRWEWLCVVGEGLCVREQGARPPWVMCARMLLAPS